MAVDWEIKEIGVNFAILELEDGVQIKVSFIDNKTQIFRKEWNSSEWIEEEVDEDGVKEKKKRVNPG